MSEAFDPYYEWLGIPPRHHPPHHYRLLGLDTYESNDNVIRRSLKRQSIYVAALRTDENSNLCDRLLEELSAAACCLLDPERRASYDTELRTKRDTGRKVSMPDGTVIKNVPEGVSDEQARQVWLRNQRNQRNQQ